MRIIISPAKQMRVDTDFDFGQITSMKISFDGSADGEIIMDNIGIYH